jgi:hypothetical protein
MSQPEEVLSPVVQTVLSYRREAAEAKRNRMALNKANFDCYHMRQDWSHKEKGQSKEFLAKQSTAVEQFVSFLQQGLVDSGDWFGVEPRPGVDPKGQIISADDIFKILGRQLEKAEFYPFVGDMLKDGALQSLMIVKVHGRKVPKVTYRAEKRWTLKGRKSSVLREERMVWQLKLDLVRAEDYYPDPTGNGLYECQDIEMDLCELVRIARENPDDYDQDAVDQLTASTDGEQTSLKSTETNQNQAMEQHTRKRVTVTECWGTILDDQGKVLHENCVLAIANERFLVRPPKPNPLWHGESPFVAAPIIRVQRSVWHKALADAGTNLNHALNEVFNLMLDAGLQSVFGVRQLRKDWLDNPSQVNDGVPAGTTLIVNSRCPPGGKVMERVDTSTEFSEATNIYRITDQEFMTSMFSNDYRAGNLPDRSVKATEVVSANQIITGMFNGIVKNIEQDGLCPILRKSWLTCAQNLNDYDEDEVIALLGKEKAMALASMDPAEIFAETAAGNRFKVFGLSTTLNKINDFKKFTALLQTMAVDPTISMAYQQEYSYPKLLGEIMKSLGLDLAKLKADPGQQPVIPPQFLALMQKAAESAQGGGKGASPGPGLRGQGPGGTAGGNQQSQTPQAAASKSPETGVDIPRGELLAGMTRPQG